MSDIHSLGPQQLILLVETSAAIAGADGLDAALQALILGMAHLTGAERGGVRLLIASDNPAGPVRLLFWQGGDVFTWQTPSESPGDHTRSVLELGRPIYTPDLAVLAGAGDADATFAVQRESIRSSLIVPLRAGGRVIGTLHANSRRPQAFDEEQILPLQVLADHAAGAVERARLRDRERTTERRLAAVVQASGAIVFSYDTEGRIDSLSGDTAALIGWTQEEMLGRLTLDLIYPSERSAIAGKMTARLHGTAAAAPYETLLLHRDGHAVPILVTGGPRVEQGRIAGGAGALTDLSALRRLQAERDAAQRASDRAEGAMRTGRAVAHELSSPLGSILVLTELVASDARLPADIREDLLIVQAEAARAGALLQRFGRITHYDEEDTPVGPQLDIQKASRPAE